MMRLALGCAVLMGGLCGSMGGQTVVGTWQGTLPGQVPERLVLTVSQAAGGGYGAELLAVDHEQVDPGDAVTFAAGVLRVALSAPAASSEGRLAADGRTLTGTWKWTPGSAGLPLTLAQVTAADSWAVDHTAHKVSRVEVEPGVKLEVLDWGGSGRPLVLLSGLGDTAHVYDSFAPKLAGRYHVYGITRRGFGASDTPQTVAENYSAERLGDDVVAVLDALKLVRPVLVGHSIAGEELSSVGSRFPGRVAGLVYLDAGSPYALYVHSPNSVLVDFDTMRREVEAVTDAATPQEQRRLIGKMLEADLPRYREALESMQKQLEGRPDRPGPDARQRGTRAFRVAQAVHDGEQPFTEVGCPLLAIFNEPAPPVVKPNASAAEREQAARQVQGMSDLQVQEEAFAALGAQAHVVRIVGGAHYVFRSNEAEVLKAIDGFVAGLVP